MSKKDMVCKTCEGAELPQRYNWRKTGVAGVLACGICNNETDFRFKHAEQRGYNKWLVQAKKTGKNVFRCRRDNKWALPDWEEASDAAFALGKRAYYDERCGFLHLTSRMTA